MKGLEPLLREKLDPKSSASTNSATPAFLERQRYNFFVNAELVMLNYECHSVLLIPYSALILDIQGLTQGISDEHEGQHQQHNCYTREDGKIGCIQNDESVVFLDHATP